MTRRIGCATVLAAAVAGVVAAPADAAPADTLYFSNGNFNCAIDASGNIGCDITQPVLMQLSAGGVDSPILIRVREVLVDSPSLPAHPGFDAGTPHTLPGGNPPISQVGTVTGTGATAGPAVSHAGATCNVGFHGAFYCESKGHGFSYYEILTAH
ncbi:hypothetical protein FOS14_17325 [Skermania sp. ID1734]|uniref:hypothetical protein n=1 Tax=Skermania sp. ID1734 TaxID=2597516 RepID=UPI00117F4357|nr:hypothetical protein [Skermania sp. ID1734]TSD96112.1 hypothetical protein FOS14_17325 [Skermania sp. ID1734]